MRVLLTGANGLLARALIKTAPTNVELIGRTRAELDITDADAVERELFASKPTVIINAAAYAAVDRAESDIAAAERVNGMAPGLLGAAASRIGAKIVHYSTDYVFDGRGEAPYTEDRRPNPINAYGRSKLHGEKALRESGAHHLIIRTQWLFGDSGPSFPNTMWARARGKLPTMVVDDQRGAPTYTGDLARATWSLLDRDDIIHVASAGDTTWFEIARRIFDAAGERHLLTACSAGQYPEEVQRPSNALLDTTRLRSFGIVMPAWTVAIDRFIARRIATESR